MRSNCWTYYKCGILLVLMLFFVDANAQDLKEEKTAPPTALTHREARALPTADTLSIDTLLVEEVVIEDFVDTLLYEQTNHEVTQRPDTSIHTLLLTVDSLQNLLVPLKPERFIPDPKRALWLSIIFPGGGQIYNRKYWKLPLVYGGFLGCVYAMTWNNTMYRDYSQAYIDIMDSDDNTKSYENFIPPQYDVNANLTRLQELFKRKKNYYRRFRDLSMFCMIGVYALSIVDAYVDAEMSSFDISRDLSMKVQPTIIHDRHSTMHAQGMNSNSYGLQCSITF